jgi:hypothetical protein
MNISDNDREKKKAQYDAFMALVKQLDQTFSKHLDDWHHQMLEAHDQVTSHSYIVALKQGSKVDSAIARLEKLFTDGQETADRSSLEIEADRKSRELRLLICLAKLALYESRSLDYVNPSALLKKRKSAAKECKVLSDKISLHMEDPYFAGLPGDKTWKVLNKTIQSLQQMAQIFKDSRPEYPYKKISGYPRLHYVVDQLARSCFRIYEHCKATDIRDLLSTSWVKWQFGFGVTDEDLRDWIKSALEQKQQDYRRRIDQQLLWHQTRPELWSDEPDPRQNSPFHL